MADNPALWAFAGSVTTAVIGLIGILIKYRAEQRKVDAEVKKVKADAESIAVAAAEKALATVTTALDREVEANAARDAKLAAQDAKIATQDQALADAGKRLTSSEERMTEMGKAVGEVRRLHREAISHIADRERWAAQRWPGARPETLPAIPVVLIPDVAAADPSLCLQVPDDTEEPHPREPPEK